MSTFRIAKKVCGLCGHTFESRELTSTNAMGSPDLDLRPPQMQRSTMSMWISRCPKCGYVHAEICKNGKQHKAYVKSKEYNLCEGNPLDSSLARNFYRYALLLLRENDRLGAYDAFLHAAWACDDMEDKEGAVICRNKAVSLYDSAVFDNPNLQLRHIDLLRRAGRFGDAINFGKTIEFKDELLKKIADFQSRLCKKNDDNCYRVADADISGAARSE